MLIPLLATPLRQAMPRRTKTLVAVAEDKRNGVTTAMDKQKVVSLMEKARAEVAEAEIGTHRA